MDSLCHPWFTTTNLSYRFPILTLPPCAIIYTQYIYIYTHVLCTIYTSTIKNGLPAKHECVNQLSEYFKYLWAKEPTTMVTAKMLLIHSQYYGLRADIPLYNQAAGDVGSCLARCPRNKWGHIQLSDSEKWNYATNILFELNRIIFQNSDNPPSWNPSCKLETRHFQSGTHHHKLGKPLVAL